MPPVTRRAAKALKPIGIQKSLGTRSDWAENDIRQCLSNYYKMRKQRRHPEKERCNYSRQHEIQFANHLVEMHRQGEIRDNISSYVVPEIQRRLNGQYGTSFTEDSIRGKYYALRGETKLYISFKRRGTGMGWDSQKFTWLMDDSQWAAMEQVNPKYGKFRNDCTVYHLLEEVFVNQGATGDFSSGFENELRTSADEREMETTARLARGKGSRSSRDEEAEIEVRGPKEAKGKGGKGKRKSGDGSGCSPMSTASGSVTDRYLRVCESIESLVSRKKSSSTSASVSSPDKNRSGRDPSKKTDYEIAMDQLKLIENVNFMAKYKAAEILKDKQELDVWNLAASDADRITWMKLKGCFPPDSQEPPPPPPF
ncbi:uncharacterized protein [Coffea arabica]|uniref:Uncharacterized protein LOC113692265 n=1 Tax=Coffea arabica TaxID=13443 RepID=A0A6P6SK42_COFAR|nr:uncharacterized protein LOC113692265 [Coffea arabica]XP_027071234.1 uncharacterized protein LOC113696093 [Coffea arabica]XP_027099520.1 uncharacterized protein LOC113718805 [Coffea arabica]XP_027105221.1 uncharacterized protein LOC113725959 [Coffea arabica]XP_027106424.1 uncharacterized protein LOC113726750 [Coffea arabica]XP_027117440.1 uncharacterized protein LOC113734878 [Coffea arabica]XP_027122453.1 uncharacterized protein LOC113739439 [Coffea arabica]